MFKSDKKNLIYKINFLNKEIYNENIDNFNNIITNKGFLKVKTSYDIKEVCLILKFKHYLKVNLFKNLYNLR